MAGIKELKDIDITKVRSKALKAFDKMSKEEQAERLNDIGTRFEQSGFETFESQDILLFLEKYKDGRLLIEHSDENLTKIAEAIHELPTGDRALISHGKVRPFVKLNRWVAKRKEKRATKKLNKLQARSELEQAALNFKYQGADHVIGRDDETSKEITAQEMYQSALNNAGWLRRNYMKLKYGSPDKQQEFVSEKDKGSETLGIDKDFYDNASWFQAANMERREKNWMATAPLSLLQERGATLDAKIEELETSIAQQKDKRVRSALQKQLDRQKRLRNTIDVASKQRELDFGNASQALAKTTAERATPLETKRRQYDNIIKEKTDILDYSTTRGKYAYALQKKAPVLLRKKLESIVNGKTEEAFTDDAAYRQELKDRSQGEGTKEPTAKILDEENEPPAIPDDENDAANEEKADRVEEGHSTQPPAPTNEWHKESMERLAGAYDVSDYTLISPQREGPNAPNDNVLYQTFQSKEDNHTITIEKPDANNYNLCAKDKDGKDSVPTVDDMKAIMESIKKSGQKQMELGTIKSPEFLARAVLAAEEAGITITNLAEKKKELANQGRTSEVKEETAQVSAQRVLKGAEIDLSDNGMDKTVDKMDALVMIKDMTEKEYQEFKSSGLYKDLNLNSKEQKIFDAVNQVKNSKEFTNTGERRQAALLGRMISDYQKAYCGAKDNSERTTRKKEFIRTNTQKFGLARNMPSSGR